MKIGADCVISSSRTALHVGALFLRNRHPSNASSLRLSPRGLTTLRGPRSSIRQYAGVLFLVIIRFSRRRKWRPRKHEAAGRLAPVNATRNVGRYLYPQKPYVLLLSEGMVRIDHQPKADLKSHPLKRQKNAPPCRCAANKTPSYATRWVASRAFTLPSSTLRMGGLQSGQTEIRLPKEKCWIISYGADAHSRVLPAVIHL